jgi:L-threonylcarbamoyladenylate synthase
VQLCTSQQLARALAVAAQGAESIGVYSPAQPAALVPGQFWRCMPGTAAATAHELFSALRDFDARGVQRILVQRPPPHPDWEGVRDRLERAAAAG